MSINLGSTNINTFLSNVFPSDVFYDYLLREKIKECDSKNLNIRVRERPAIFKFIMLQTLSIAKILYGINNIKIYEEYMKEMNKLTIEDFNENKDEDKNDLEIINAKKEFEFISKHENISNNFLNNYTILHNDRI